MGVRTMKRASCNLNRGMGGVIDLMPAPRRSRIGEGIHFGRSVATTLQNDWQRVAGDFRTAFDHTTRETRGHAKSKRAG